MPFAVAPNWRLTPGGKFIASWPRICRVKPLHSPMNWLRGLAMNSIKLLRPASWLEINSPHESRCDNQSELRCSLRFLLYLLLTGLTSCSSLKRSDTGSSSCGSVFCVDNRTVLSQPIHFTPPQDSPTHLPVSFQLVFMVRPCIVTVPCPEPTMLSSLAA